MKDAPKLDADRSSRLIQRALAAAGATGLHPFAYGPLAIAAGLIGAYAKSDEEAVAALVRFIKAEKP